VRRARRRARIIIAAAAAPGLALAGAFSLPMRLSDRLAVDILERALRFW
jgi:hypothetical protein